MIVLGLDTCLTACSVAVCDGARVLAYESEAMARGHQERLAPMAERVMAQAGLAFAALERIGVDRKSTRLNSSHVQPSRMPSSA